MAAIKKENATPAENAEQVAEKAFIVKVTNDPNYCGIGAGGVQFANGEAKITSARMVQWFKEHPGYTVTEQ